MEYRKWERDSVYPSFADPFFAEHLSRYVFAKKYVEDLSVLDLGCGKGYGSYLLSSVAGEVCGADLNSDSIEFAKKKYLNKNLNFSLGNVIEMKGKKAFDCITCFEVIEHLHPSQTQEFLLNLKQLLLPGGRIFISTPNHEVVLRSGMPVPEFHINNFKSRDLAKTLKKYFKNVEMFGQIQSLGKLRTLIYYLDQLNLRHFMLSRAGEGQPNDNELEVKDWPIWNSDKDLRNANHFIFSKLLWRQAGMTLAICTL